MDALRNALCVLAAGVLSAGAAAAQEEVHDEPAEAPSEPEAAQASPAEAQGGAAQELAAPAAREEDPGAELHLATSLQSDRATVLDEDGSREAGRCMVPCTLPLAPGRYRLRFERARMETTLELERETALLVRSRPLDDAELGVGLGLVAAGAVALVMLAVLHEDPALCLALGSSCPFGAGHLVLGLGIMSVAIGIGLSIDAAGYLSVQPMPRFGRAR